MDKNEEEKIELENLKLNIDVNILCYRSYD